MRTLGVSDHPWSVLEYVCRPVHVSDLRPDIWAEERNKITAFTETGVGQREVDATWWTDVLLETLKSSPSTGEFAWVLAWRNADLRRNSAAFPGAATAEDFKTFEADPLNDSHQD